MGFSAQLRDLHADANIYGDLDKLNVNPNFPFLPFNGKHVVNYSDSDWLESCFPKGVTRSADDIHEGLWYSKTVKRYQDLYGFDTNCDILEPIIITGDRTVVTGNARQGLEPFLFTSTIIKRQYRNASSSWRHLGLMPDIEQKSKSQKRKLDQADKHRPGRSLRNYHKCMDVIVDSLIKYQQITNVPQSEFDYNKHGHVVRLGTNFTVRRVFAPVLHIVGDGKSADCLGGRIHHNGNFNKDRIENKRIRRSYDPNQTWGGLGSRFISDCTGVSVEEVEDHIINSGNNADEDSSSDQDSTEEDLSPVPPAQDSDTNSDQTGDSSDDENAAEESTPTSKTKKNAPN